MIRKATFAVPTLFFIAAVSLPIIGFSQQAGDQAQSQDQGPPTILRTLRRGSSGEDVRRLQNYLSRLPDIYPEGLATGYFGSLTEAAVRRFQEQNGVPAVGIVGPMTRERLSRAEERVQGIQDINRTFRRGASGDNVRRLQEFLRMFPDIYPERQVTGNFGPSTENAVRRFQEVGGRTPSGEVDAGTQELINSLIVEGERQKPPKISGVSPTSGPAGVTVTVKGKGFTPENNAIFVRGKTVVSGLSSDDGGTSITFVLPSTAPCTVNPPKACPIKVLNQNGISNARPFKLVGLPEAPQPEPEPTPTPTPIPSPTPTPEPAPVPPSITGLTPPQGPVGTNVTINGTGFTATGNAVNFAGVASAVAGLASAQNGKTITFTVPQTSCQVGSACSVSVTNANGTSNAVSFLLTQVITPIKVSVPNGGEQFNQGLQNRVSWTGGTDRVQILLVSSDTANGVDPTSKILGWIATSTTPDGSLMWDARKVCNVEGTLCSEVTPGQYKILALSEDELGALTLWDDILNKAGNWDLSDNPFSVLELARVVVTVPNWGGTYSVGQYLVVCWYSYDLASKQVTIVLLKGDQVYRVIKTASQGSVSGLFEGGFYLPTDLPSGSDYKIQVYDATNPSIHDESDAPFTVVSASSYIGLTAPNGGETWTAGFKGFVKWSSVNIASQALNINLLKGGVFYRTLASNFPQKYSWSTATYTGGTFDVNLDIPADIPPGSDYTLEITDAANPSVRDTSNQPFTVVKLPDTLTIRAKFLDHMTKQPLANQSVGMWDGTAYRQVLTSSAGELLLTANTADVIAKRYISFNTYPSCYEYKYFSVFANIYGLYGQTSLFPLLGGWKQVPVLGEANFGDAPFWQITDAKMISDTPVKPSFYYRNSATGQSWQSGWSYSSAATMQTYWKALPLGVDAWAKLEDLSGQVSYSPFVNVPWGHCTAKSLSNFNKSIQWEPYQVSATASYSPTFLKIGNVLSGSIQASGGTAPYTFTVASGILPPGVTLASTGVLSGTTTQTGIYDAMIRAQDAQGTNGAATVHIEVRNSDGTLSPYLRVYYPYGGTQWYPGSTVWIGWSGYSIAGKSVKIELLKGGTPYRTITTYTQSYPTGWFNYSWTIPQDLPAGSDYAIRVSDASDASVVSQSDPLWIVSGQGAVWYTWSSPNYLQQSFYFKYPSSNLSSVTAFKIYQKMPGQTTSYLIASCPSQSTYYYSYCTTTTSMLASGYWYLYSWSGQIQLNANYYSSSGSGFSTATLPAGAYEYSVTTVDSSGVESAPIAALKMHVMERIAINSPTVTQSPIATPFKIQWNIPVDWPQGADRSFYASVQPKTSAYYNNPLWYAAAGPFSGLETAGFRLYEGPALDPTLTYQAGVRSTPSILDPATGSRAGYLGISNLSSFWVKP